jgi:hypothetical protein
VALSIVRATKLVIQQSRDSMGITVPGEPLRDVSWGTVERDGVEIQAGWGDTGALVVRSKADGGSLTERYVITDDGRSLMLETRFNPSRGRTLNLVRYFDRFPPPPPSRADAS